MAAGVVMLLATCELVRMAAAAGAHLLADQVRIQALRATPHYTAAGVSSVISWDMICPSNATSSLCEFYSLGNGHCLMMVHDPRVAKTRQEKQSPNGNGITNSSDGTTSDGNACVSAACGRDAFASRRESSSTSGGDRGGDGSSIGGRSNGTTWSKEGNVPSEVLQSYNCRVHDVVGTVASNAEASVATQLFHCPKDVPLAILPLPKCGTTSVVNWALTMEGDEERKSLARATAMLLQEGPMRFVQEWLGMELHRVRFFMKPSDFTEDFTVIFHI